MSKSSAKYRTLDNDLSIDDERTPTVSADVESNTLGTFHDTMVETMKDDNSSSTSTIVYGDLLADASSPGDLELTIHNPVNEGIEQSLLSDKPRVVNTVRRQQSDETDQITESVSLLLKNQTCMIVSMCFIAAMAMSSFLLMTYKYRPYHRNHNDNDNNDDGKTNSINSYNNINSVSFGSCTSHDLTEMSIFDDAIIPSKPEAWIWTGDLAYLDNNEINCNIFDNSQEWQMSCNCTASYIEDPPYSCHAGDIEYAKNRWIKRLEDMHYSNFLEYMCPDSLWKGFFPPTGDNPEVCPRPLLGIYDDHDFGWNNANTRENNKDDYKNLYLDAIGDPITSPRRNSHRGAYTRYTLNSEDPSREVDIILLDERYERSPLPCNTRRDYCQYILDTHSIHTNERVWCEDFLTGGMRSSSGSCCHLDEEIYYGWCRQPGVNQSVYYRDACDITYEYFGMRPLVYDRESKDLRLYDPTRDKVDLQQSSTFCEVLGKKQRQWLREHLRHRDPDHGGHPAAVTLYISPSVVIDNPLPRKCAEYSNESSHLTQEVYCTCGGDNLDCYSVAQQELLYLISHTRGCSVILTGDYHFSDLKYLTNETVVNGYEFFLGSPQGLYQVMASGMTTSTAHSYTCEDYRLDPLHLRTHPECEFVTGPNFGRVLFDFDEQSNQLKMITLQILSGVEANQVLLETKIDPKTCYN